MPSFDKINYSLRVNKNVERKLLVEIIESLRPDFPVEDYRYIGFGSIWYSDFILMHRRLSITDMISVEKERSRIDRATFNLPFACVKLLEGEYSEHVAKMRFDKPVIAWLDYDDGIAGPLLSDVASTVHRVQSGSVLIVSSNAESRQLDNPMDGIERASFASDVEFRGAILQHCAPGLVPQHLDSRSVKNGFPELLADIMFAAIDHAALRSGRNLKIQRLCNIVYSDNAEMVTVGVLVYEPEKEELVARKRARAARGFYYTDKQFRIDVPHLTRKEKLALDQLLPTGDRLSPKKLKFTLPDRMIDAYRQFYACYPTFEEIV